MISYPSLIFKGFIAVLVLMYPLAGVAALSDEKKAQVNEYINQYMIENKIVGVALGLAEQGSVSWLQGYGYADIVSDTKVDPSVTLFRWASLSKQVTSVLVMKLRALGYLQLDDNIEDYLIGYRAPDKFTIKCEGSTQTIDYNGVKYNCENSPYFQQNRYAQIPLPDDARTITFALLLANYAGIEHYDNGWTNPEPPTSKADDPTINRDVEWALEYFDHAPLVAVPNTQYSYSTFGFDLVGVAAAFAHGGRYEDLVQAAVLEKVYTQVPSIVPDKIWLAQFRPQRATGYVTPDITAPDNDVSYKLPGGGFMSTVADAVRFAAHFRNNSLLTDEEKAIVWKPYHPEKNSGYGLGFEVYYQGAKLVYAGHTGSQPKARTVMRFYPQQDIAIVIMSNSDSFDPTKVANAVMNIILGSKTEEQAVN